MYEKSLEPSGSDGRGASGSNVIPGQALPTTQTETLTTTGGQSERKENPVAPERLTSFVPIDPERIASSEPRPTVWYKPTETEDSHIARGRNRTFDAYPNLRRPAPPPRTRSRSRAPTARRAQSFDSPMQISTSSTTGYNEGPKASGTMTMDDKALVSNMDRLSLGERSRTFPEDSRVGRNPGYDADEDDEEYCYDY